MPRYRGMLCGQLHSVMRRCRNAEVLRNTPRSGSLGHVEVSRCCGVFRSQVHSVMPRRRGANVMRSIEMRRSVSRPSLLGHAEVYLVVLRCRGAESTLRSGLLGYAEVLRSALRLGVLGHAEVPRCLEEAEKGSAVRFIQLCGDAEVPRFTRLCRGADVPRSAPRSDLLGHAEVPRCQGVFAVRFIWSCQGTKECFEVRFTWSCGDSEMPRSAPQLGLLSHDEVPRCQGVLYG
ncbi:hypothetical protein NE237_032911 [Protea cynaroides]|uniref:Uncharacterized protein n=1 Tax=Protea cynaroides TaxID=273540 RepID=A0A9Q0L597_9MAGN|nr:hypothetical protein NE237_032911 [Protea cynaroides]